MDRRQNNLKRNNLEIERSKNKLNPDNQRPYSYAKEIIKGKERPERKEKVDTNDGLESQFHNVCRENKNYDNQELQINLRPGNLKEDLLKASTGSATTYCSIRPESEFQAFKPELPPVRQHQPVRKPKAPRYQRIFLLTVVILIILAAVGVLVYFFGFKTSDKCHTPTVDNGNVTVEGDTLTLGCAIGTKPLKTQITCDNGMWSDPIACPLVDCDCPTFLPNDHKVCSLKNTTYGSVATLFCDNGYMATCSPHYECSADGNWVSSCNVSCEPHPCGKYKLPLHATLKNDFSYINMTVEIQCEDGFQFKSGSDIFLRCMNETWLQDEEQEECHIPGEISFTTEEQDFLVGSANVLRIAVANSPSWRIIQVTRVKSNDMEPTVITTIYNTSGVVDTQNVIRSDIPKVNSFPTKDGMSIELNFEVVKCDDSGTYVCSIIVGNIQQPTAVKSVNTTLKVIESAASKPVLTAPTHASQGTTITCTCNGTLGLNQIDEKQGLIYLQIRYQNEGAFRNNSVVTTHSVKKDCKITEYIEAKIKVTNEMDNATFRCMTLTTFDEPPIYSDIQILTVNTSTVELTASTNVFKKNGSPAIGVRIQNILGWTSIDFRKQCNTSTVYARITSNGTVEEFQHVWLTNLLLSNESAVFKIQFNATTCSDACLNGSHSVYVASVALEQEQVEGSVNIDFFDEAQRPTLFAEPDIFYLGQKATIICQGDVGVPARNMSLLKNQNTLRATSSPAVFYSSTCDNMHIIAYTFIVSSKDNGDEYICQTELENTTIVSSHIITVQTEEAVLYFTPESRNAEIDNFTRLSCVLTLTSNLTYMSLFRGKQIKPLCTVHYNGSGSCAEMEEKYYNVEGHFDENGTKYFMNVNIPSVRCIDHQNFTCLAKGASEHQTVMELNVTKKPSKPVLHLPFTLIQDQKTFDYDKEELNCTAYLGYPMEGRSLQLHILYLGADGYVSFKPEHTATGDCDKNATIEHRSLTFGSVFNASRLRCAIVDSLENIVLEDVKVLNLFKNTCLLNETDSYYPHPSDCTKYMRCVSGTAFFYQCASPTCHKNSPLYNDGNICTGDCSNC